MEIDQNVFRWLANHKILSLSDRIIGGQQQQGDPICQLDASTTKSLEIGTKIGELLQKINNNNQTYMGYLSLDKLKDSATQASRLYNWNILSDAMKKMGIEFHPDIKSLIVSGDTQMLAEVIKDIYEYDMNQLERISIPSSANSFASNPRNHNQKGNSRPQNSSSAGGSTGGVYEETRKQQQLNSRQNKLDGETGVDLNLLDTSKNLQETKSLLEYFLVAISRNFTLRPKQSASLLANGNKYLAHVFVKGLKNDFNPVEKFLQEIYVSMKRLLVFIEVEEGNIPIILNTLKPGLLSKSEEVALWTCRILSKLCFDMANLELLAPGYEWFSSNMGGMYSSVMCLRRHHTLRESVVSFMLQISRYNLTDSLTIQLRRVIENPKEYIDFINLIFPSLKSSKMSKDELLSGKIIDFWVEQCLKMAENDPILNSISDRESALSLLVSIWKSYPLYIEETPGLTEKTLDLLKKGSRDRHFCLQIGCLAKLFELLDYLASDRNPLAALIYKKLTFSFIENHSDLSIRAFILSNFQVTFNKFSTIPTEVLLEPLIRQIQVQNNIIIDQVSSDSSYVINTCDIEFLKISCQHPKLKLKVCIQIMDLLSKIYLNDLVFAGSVYDPISAMVPRFIEDEAFQEYLVKLAKISLAMLFNSCKNRKGNKQRFDKYGKNLYEALNEANETEIINAQKRGLIITLLKMLIEFLCQNLNLQLKPLIVQVYIQLKQIKQENKGIVMLLGLLGDPQSIIAEIEAQNAIQEQEEKERLSRLEEYNQLYAEKNQESSKTPKIYKGDNFNEEEKPKSDHYFQSESHNEFVNDRLSQASARSKRELSNNDVDYIPKPDMGQKSKSTNVGKRIDKNMNSKAIQQIEQIKQKREEEARRKQQEEELKRVKMTQQIKAAEKEINKRNVKLGVGKENDDNIPLKLVYEENMLAPQRTDQLTLVNIDEQEDRDKDSVTLSLRKFQRAIKQLFTKYSNILNPIKKGEFFAQIKEKQDLIGLPDFLKMAKETEILDLCSKEEIQQLFKLINMKNQDKGDLTPLDIEDFTKLLVQVAFLSYKRPPNDLRAKPSGASIDALFKQIGTVLARKGENTSVFTNPDSTNATPQEQAMIKQLNSALLEDPNHPLPQNFKKVFEKNQKVTFAMNPFALKGLNEGYLYAYEVVNDLLNSIFKINLIEPITKMEVIPKVKLITQQSLTKKPPQVQPSAKENQDIGQRSIVDQDDNQSVKSMKSGQIGRLNNLKSFGDININVDSQLQRGRTRSPKLIVNKALQSKQDQQENEIQRKKSQDLRIKQRQQELKEQLEKIKEEKKEQEEKQRIEEKSKKLEQEEQERKRIEKQKKEQESKKQKLKEHQLKLEEEKKQKDQQMVGQKKEQELQKKKEVDEFIKKQRQKLEKDFQDKEQLKQKEKDDREKEKDLEKQKQDLRKKKVSQAIDKEKEKREIEKNNKKWLDDLEFQAPVQQVFSKNEKVLKAVYNHFKEYTDFKIDRTDKDNLGFKGFVQFVAQFNISHTVLPADEVQSIFKILVKDKNISDNSLNFTNFQTALVRLIHTGRQFFNDFNARLAKDDPDAKIAGTSPEKAKDNEETDTDLTFVIGAFNGFFKYLSLPSEKQELAAKLREMKTEAGRIVPKQTQNQSVEDIESKSVQDAPIRGRATSLAKGKEQSSSKNNRSVSKPMKSSTTVPNEAKPKERSKSKPAQNSQARSRSNSLKAVDVLSLKPADSKLSNIIAPDGQKEKWEHK